MPVLPLLCVEMSDGFIPEGDEISVDQALLARKRTTDGQRLASSFVTRGGGSRI
jgi:hypothetical protein